MKKINIIGFYDKNNVGDESYKIVFNDILSSKYELLFSDYIKKNFDAYILGGGDVVTDKILSDLEKIDKPKFLMSVTIPENVDTKKLKQFETIIVRDKRSQEILNSNGILNILCPDFTFSLDFNKEAGKKIIDNMLENQKIDIYKERIAIIINGHLMPSHSSISFNDVCFEKLARDIGLICDNYPANFIFIPFSTRMPWDDRVSNSICFSKTKFWKKNLMIYDRLSQLDCLNIIASCDAVISTRLHSSIFSCITGTPYIDIIHNHKNKHFNDTISYKNTFEYGEFGYKSVLNKLKNMKNDNTSFILSDISKNQKNFLNEIIKNVHFI